MRTLHVFADYYDLIVAGEKTLEVRVGYSNVKNIEEGQQVVLVRGRSSGAERILARIAGVRRYENFSAMLAKEDPAKIDPLRTEHLLATLRWIYPADKEAFGVYVLELRVPAAQA